MSDKSKKVINKLVAYVLTALTVLFGATMVYVLAKKAHGKVPKIFGYTVLQIVSGSMEKEIPAGAYILVKEVDADEIEIEDVISFYSSDPSILGYPNTHRVVGILEGEQGLEFVTRGDANATPDAYTVKEAKLIGRYVKTLTGLTATVEFFTTNGLGVVAVMMFLSIGMVCVSGFIKGKDEKKE